MHRRTILRGAAAGVATALAGCAENSTPGDDPTDSEDGTTEAGDGSDDADGDSGGSDGGDGTPTDADAPALVDAALERRGDCSEPGTAATVAFADDAVTVDGCLEAANGCIYPELASAGYEDDAFVVAVEGVDESDPDEACTQAIEYRAYEATASFEGGVPATVEVRHDGELVTEARPE
ncbi:hypothetical protein [Haloparvum sedimenti]|uniref:hypothetical protein n=1 Tax=Haloparvum sedimenti TaxID=1678448 RepID=UPI00071E6B94|nr:hypothetical protein [Haloparvum sedimenti]